MTDERAIELANLLGEYWVECRGEGMGLTEVQNMTVREVVADIQASSVEPLSLAARILLNP